VQNNFDIKTADSKGNVFLLNVKEIEYFQAQQKYTCVYSKGREYLITTGIKTLTKAIYLKIFIPII
jgi:DNA-binding LytR/AlgR family response regulator